ncbi:hypothetical protein BDP55DRAFT_625214 [Colletotrichum godetiae]|uniref:Uncharacterized protein n=1 Tax=Colletotrichum godetiae TaxID=1209918 RepID=A0AAJ0F4Z9_9PEZI|nr:uncharacterized protein BDP55DRAFT_625214 [Colletotrichum godetiae]KAK1700952.1 hypothetical protein BDP55DRAFT_625214 [Colletotrichum godetiae]
MATGHLRKALYQLIHLVQDHSHAVVSSITLHQSESKRANLDLITSEQAPSELISVTRRPSADSVARSFKPSKSHAAKIPREANTSRNFSARKSATGAESSITRQTMVSACTYAERTGSDYTASDQDWSSDDGFVISFTESKKEQEVD